MKTFRLHWDTLACLPNINGKSNPGVAGAFSGISHDQLLVAGGANFPAMPAWKNGVKKYWDVVYSLQFDQGKPGKWSDTIFHLPYPVAYGASLTTDQGIICIGGKNDRGYLANVSLLQWNELKETIDIKSLPDLPVPLASLAAARMGDTVYVAGGENKNGKQACFYQLDLRQPQAGWKVLPALPGGALSDAVLVSQSDGNRLCIYMIGGRTTAYENVTTFYNTVYKFDPVKGNWQELQGITRKNGSPVALAAGTGIAIEDHYIVLIGGDDGILFNRLAVWKENAVTAREPERRKYWEQRYDSLFIHHPGFNRNIYLYNTLTDTWTMPGSLSCPAPATTNILQYRQQIIIPSGEIRPGVRTAAILEAKIFNTGTK